MASREHDALERSEVLSHLSQFYGRLTTEGEATTGSISETMFFSNEKGERFVLQRNALGRDAESLEAESEFVEYLRANGFPGISAIRMDSKPFFKYEEGVYSIYPFVQGSELDINNPTQVKEAFVKIGQFLALSSLYNTQIGDWRNRWWNILSYPFEKNFQMHIEESPYAESIRACYQISRDNLFSHLITPARQGLYKAGIIHSDFRPEHLLFEGNTLKGVIDWTSAHHDVFVMEFARPFLYLCQSLKQRGELLNATDDRLKFSQEEREAAFYSPLLMEFVEFMWVMGHKDSFGEEEFKREMVDAVERVNAAYEIYREIS